MSIKIENLIKITTDGSYLLLTPEEYRALTGQTSAPVALKDINWNGQMPELAKDQRIYELEVDVERLLKIRNSQKAEIEKLRGANAKKMGGKLPIGCKLPEVMPDDIPTSEYTQEINRLNDIVKEQKEKITDQFKKLENMHNIIDGLEKDLDAMTLKAKGMVEKPEWKNPFDVDRCRVCGVVGIHRCYTFNTDHGTSEVLRELEADNNMLKTVNFIQELLADGDIEPVEPTPVPEPELIAEVIPELETVPEPVFNDTAVTAEEVTSEKYPAKKKKTGGVIKFTASQTEKYMGMIRENARHKDVVAAMVEDTGITPNQANSRYYTLMKRTTVTKGLNLQRQSKPSAMTDELKAKYLTMVQENVPLDEVIKAISEDLSIAENTARNHYGRIKLKAESIEALAKINYTPPGPPQNPVTTVSPTGNLSRLVYAELEALPDYGSLKEFKNACCDHPVLRGYNIIDLKGQYKATHKNLTW